MFMIVLIMLSTSVIGGRMATPTTRDDDGLLGPTTDKEERALGKVPEWVVPERTIDKFNI